MYNFKISKLEFKNGNCMENYNINKTKQILEH